MSDDWAESLPDGVISLRAFVWECGDEWCDCSQARIEGATRTNAYGQRLWDVLWQGTFRSGWPYEYDEDSSTEGGPSTELNREARRLRRHHNALYHRIEWPWGRTRRLVEARQVEADAVLAREQRHRDALARDEAGRTAFVGAMREFVQQKDEARRAT